MSRRTIILGLRRLYHVARKEDHESIQTKGLLPQSEVHGLYKTMSALPHPAVFLCTRRHLQSFIRMVTRLPLNQPSHDVVVFSVSADFVARLEFDVDPTYSCVADLLNRRIPFAEIIEKCGAIVCFGEIPPAELELVEYQLPAGPAGRQPH